MFRAGTLKPETFAPYPKNPVIGAFFREIDRADELGSGMRNLMLYGKKYGGADPQLIEGDIFQMVISVPEFGESPADARGQISVEPAENGSPKGSPKSSPKGSLKTEDRILEMMRKDKTISTEEMGIRLGISKRAIIKQTNKLQEAGRLKRIGPAKGGHWEVDQRD